jgi:hypothetical protein
MERDDGNGRTVYVPYDMDKLELVLGGILILGLDKIIVGVLLEGF